MAQKKLRLVFMGTPAFAAGLLTGLLKEEDFELCAVYTQPDKASGRGKKVQSSPVKLVALEAGLPVLQPTSLKNEESQAELKAFAPDFLVVAAYGMILPQSVLDIPRYAPINVHTSLLPLYRGAAPVQRAIMDDCPETGVSIMAMEAGLDTGPVYAVEKVRIERDTAASLFEKLERCSLPLLCSVLRGIVAGTAKAQPQEGEWSYAAKLSNEESQIDFARPVKKVDAHIRAVTPDPSAKLCLDLENGTQVNLVLEEVAPLEGEVFTDKAGSVFAKKGALCVLCSDGALSLLRVKPVGKKSMDIASFLNGLRIRGANYERIGEVK